jgi:hypothetical protein
VSARLRAAVDDPATPLARLRVVAQQVAPAGAQRAITAADLPADGAYHQVALEISNPRWQALGFVVDYLGAGEVALDTITVTPLADRLRMSAVGAPASPRISRYPTRSWSRKVQ